MELFILYTTFILMFFCVMVMPKVICQLSRSVIYNMTYKLSLTDGLLSLSICYLYVYGLPQVPT